MSLILTPFSVPLASSFNRRIKIPISPSVDGRLTDIQVRITITKGTGSSSPGNIYLQNLSSSWPYDIAFATSDGTFLPSWREEYDSIDGTWVVRIPVIDSAINTDIYLYYGSLYYPDLSNETATFPFFSSFSNGMDETLWNSRIDYTSHKLTSPSGDIAVSNSGTYYEAWPAIDKLSNGNLIATYRTGVTTHGWGSGGKLVCKVSTDNGITWGSEAIIAYTAGMDARDAGLLIFDNNGVETVLCCYHKGSPPNGVDTNVFIRTSIDGGATWSAEVLLTTDHTPSWAHGDPIQLSNGRILIPVYYSTTDQVYFNVKVYYSDDNASTWHPVMVENPTVNNINETSIVELSNGQVLAYCRPYLTGTPQHFRKFVSLDYGLTWSDYGYATELPCMWQYNPPRLKRFSDGNLYIIYNPFSYSLNNAVIFRSDDQAQTWKIEGAIPYTLSGNYYQQYCSLVEISGSLAGVVSCTNDSSVSDIFYETLSYPFGDQSKWWQTVKSGYTEISYNINDWSTTSPGKTLNPPLVLEWYSQEEDYEAVRKTPFSVGLGEYNSIYSTNCARKVVATYNQFCIIVTDSSGNRSYTSGTVKDYDWHRWKIIWTPTKVRLFQDDVQIGSDLVTYIPSTTMPVSIGPCNLTGYGQKANFKWILARKYTENEPAWGNPGNVEVL